MPPTASQADWSVPPDYIIKELVARMLARLYKDSSAGLHGVAPMLLKGAWYDFEVASILFV